MSAVSKVLVYAALPAAAVLMGGIVASVRAPGPKFRSVVQHFTSGLLFAVVGTELLPMLCIGVSPWPTLWGFLSASR